jgi:DNA-binding NarL/FixJ family response regulator
MKLNRYAPINLLWDLIQSLNVLKQTRTHRKDTLTKREQQVLLRIGESSKSRVIAGELNLSIATIETYRKNIRKKLKRNSKAVCLPFHYYLVCCIKNLRTMPIFKKDKTI